MTERRQLPPQIKRIELAQRDGGRAVIRYQLTVDVGIVDGQRKQLRKRYGTEKRLGPHWMLCAATSPRAHTCIRQGSHWPKHARTGWLRNMGSNPRHCTDIE
jgi:hypothetical protein